MRYEDLSKQKFFNEWEVLYRVDNKWMCRCSCGTEQLVQSQHLKGGTSTRCRKCGDKSSSIKRRQDTSNSILGNYFSQILWGAKVRNIEIVDINKENLYELLVKQNYKCALSGIKIIIASTRELHNQGITTASLDRKDSNLPYLLSNVQWVHKDINKMKNDFSIESFVNYCELVTRNKNGTLSDI